MESNEVGTSKEIVDVTDHMLSYANVHGVSCVRHLKLLKDRCNKELFLELADITGGM